MQSQGKSRRIFAIFMVFSMVLALMPTNAYAVTWKKLSLKKIGAYDSLSTQVSKSYKLKKTGYYKLSMKGGNGIVRFTAPKTKTYTFTFSKLASSEVQDVACVAGICTVANGSYTYKNVKTNEGTRPRIHLVSTSLANGKTFKLDGYKYRSIKTRYAKIKIKKGKSVYLALDARDLSNYNVRASVRLKIS